MDSQAGVALQGWDLIQETVLSHDEDMIADFADDIDTLLVFVSSHLCSYTIRRDDSLVCVGRSFLRCDNSFRHHVHRPSPAGQLPAVRAAAVAHRIAEWRIVGLPTLPQFDGTSPPNLHLVPRLAECRGDQQSLVHQPRSQPRSCPLWNSRQAVVSRVPPMALDPCVGARERVVTPDEIRRLGQMEGVVFHCYHPSSPVGGACPFLRRTAHLRAIVLGTCSRHFGLHRNRRYAPWRVFSDTTTGPLSLVSFPVTHQLGLCSSFRGFVPKHVAIGRVGERGFVEAFISWDLATTLGSEVPSPRSASAEWCADF